MRSPPGHHGDRDGHLQGHEQQTEAQMAGHSHAHECGEDGRHDGEGEVDECHRAGLAMGGATQAGAGGPGTL